MMNKYILLAISILFVSCSSSQKYTMLPVEVVHTGVAYSSTWSDLNGMESDRVLAALDKRCGQYWCLNGWTYHFRNSGRIVCSFKENKCYLSAKVYVDANRTVFRSCLIGDVDMVRDIIHGNQTTDSFNIKVVRCIEE